MKENQENRFTVHTLEKYVEGVSVGDTINIIEVEEQNTTNYALQTFINQEPFLIAYIRENDKNEMKKIFKDNLQMKVDNICKSYNFGHGVKVADISLKLI